VSGDDRTFGSFAEMARAARGLLQAKEGSVRTALRKTARQGRNFTARETVPKAFGELRDSIHVVDTTTGANIVCDAPYAAAVEVGSRPHTPPLGPLIAWVTLRGIQGLTKSGGLRKWKVTTPTGSDSRAAAQSVAGALRGRLGRQGAASWRANAQGRMSAAGGPAEDADPATVAVARAIQAGIAKHGTKPSWYARRALPEIKRELDRFVREAMAKSAG
jgi:hypothetical protein